MRLLAIASITSKKTLKVSLNEPRPAKPPVTKWLGDTSQVIWLRCDVGWLLAARKTVMVVVAKLRKKRPELNALLKGGISV
jgi:hypothetical protein